MPDKSGLDKTGGLDRRKPVVATGLRSWTRQEFGSSEMHLGAGVHCAGTEEPPARQERKPQTSKEQGRRHRELNSHSLVKKEKSFNV